MNLDAGAILGALFIGLGATLVMDGWNVFLKRAFGIPSLNLGLLGRWLLHMPEGVFWHDRISAAAPKSGEGVVGWVAHYSIGAAFAVGFLALVSGAWLERPTLWPALCYGLGTVVFPFFILQPALGLGLASSRAPSPSRARWKSLMTHALFGIGLYGCACVMRGLS